jgi:hypothetical protein
LKVTHPFIILISIKTIIIEKEEWNMRFILATPSEGKQDFLSKKYKLNDEQIDLILAVGANDQAFEWLCKNLNKGDIILPEDGEKLKNQISQFYNLAKSPKFKSQHSPDLMRYTPAALFELLNEGSEELMSGKEVLRKTKEGEISGAELIYKDDIWKVFKVTSPEAARILGSNTNWCTTSPSTAQQYLEKGPLYIFHKIGKAYAQLHPQSGQFMDRRDKTLKDGKMLRDGYLYEIMEKIQNPEIANFLDNLLPLIHPSERYLNSIKNKNPQVLVQILNQIQIERYRILEPQIFMTDVIPDIAITYCNCIETREPEIEQYIIDKPNWAAAYAIYVIKGKWPEAEKAIKKSKLIGIYYKLTGIGENQKISFKEFLALIRENGIKKRFPEFELQLIKQDKDAVISYCKQLKFDWQELFDILNYEEKIKYCLSLGIEKLELEDLLKYDFFYNSSIQYFK